MPGRATPGRGNGWRTHGACRNRRRGETGRRLAAHVPVAGDRSDRHARRREPTPVAYTNLSHDEIARNSYGFDIPSVLALTPSMIATNETGIGIGGTSIRLRGTDATRLNVTINGVSMNNPDSHSMYWYDTPDLISSVGTVQVQRGAGISTNGTGAFGGAVNMTTERPSGPISAAKPRSPTDRTTPTSRPCSVSSGLHGRPLGRGRTPDAHRLGRLHRPRGHGSQILHVPGRLLQRTVRCVKLLSFGGKAKTYLTYNGVTKEDMKRYGRRYHDSGQYVTSDGPIRAGRRHRTSTTTTTRRTTTCRSTTS